MVRTEYHLLGRDSDEPNWARKKGLRRWRVWEKQGSNSVAKQMNQHVG